MEVPRHVAIILDGNGRWAKSKGMPRNFGHAAGAKNVETICRAADAMGISYLTLYAFSTENWNRPKAEVSALLKLLESYLADCEKTAEKNHMCVRVIGEKHRLEEKFQRQIASLEAASAHNTGLHLTIAINYGGRDEIVRAARRAAADAAAGMLDPASMTEETFSSYLDTALLPDPDLLIRTSGEMRLSNFLLWQLAYSEFYFTDVPWPDFNEEQLRLAVEAYGSRSRRFGRVSEGK